MTTKSLMKTFIMRLFPWLITAAALYIAFHDIDFDQFVHTARHAAPEFLLIAVALTALSYLLRARRWQLLYPTPSLSFHNSWRVLTLGFFMNNILPARTGEFVRAHMGARVTGDKRTLVLATITCERLADGLCLSLFFVLFAFWASPGPVGFSLRIVSLGFAAVTGLIALVIWGRRWCDPIVLWIKQKFPYPSVNYALDRVDVFLNGLRPLFRPSLWPKLVLSSVLVWSIESCVYFFTARAFHHTLSLETVMLFMVSVNFSSLIPSAPGGFGVIEAIASTCLVSIGIDREVALAMVIAQHLIQYIVVGVPGVFIMFSWQKTLEKVRRQLELGESETEVH